MKELKHVYGSWCLLAGAAEGLGEAYSLALAKDECLAEMMDAIGETSCRPV